MWKRHADTEVVEFDGVQFRRSRGKRYFWGRVWNAKRCRYRVDSLHRTVWSFHHGDIPDGCDIHHKDEDWNNNDVSNLECLTRAEHNRRHRAFEKWNKTEAAKEHHRKIAGMWVKTAVYRDYKCEHCGGTFKSRHLDPTRLRWCSSACGWRSQLGIKQKKCRRCGKPYWNRPGSFTCSEECSFELFSRICVICDKKFDGRKKRKSNVCCSRKCGTAKRGASLRSSGRWRS